MNSFRFVHSADLHLDSPFKGKSEDMPDHLRSSLIDATFSSYKNIIDLCVASEVDAFIVAGDIYDGADRSFKAQKEFIDGLRELSDRGISSFVAHGNHDPLDGWQSKLEYPAKYHQFTSQAESRPLFPDRQSEVVIHGVSYQKRETKENLVPQFHELETGEFNIGVLHANVGNNTDHDPYAPCSITDLVETGFDYWALGHVHTRQILRDSAPTIVYPGNSQSRHINETDAKGALLVTVNEYKNVEIEFHATDVIRWARLSIETSDIQDLTELQDILVDRCQQLLQDSDGRAVMTRIELVGSTDIHKELVRIEDDGDDYLRAQLNEHFQNQTPFLWCEKLRIATRQPYDRTAIVAGSDFSSEVLKVLDELRDNNSDLDSLRQNISDGLHNKSRFKAYLADLSSPQLLEMLDLAESRIIQNLLEEED